MRMRKMRVSFWAHLPLRCRAKKNVAFSRFQILIHLEAGLDLQSSTKLDLFRRPRWERNFTANHYGEISLLQNICDNRSHVRGQTHTCTPFVTFNASHLFHFCHTHTVILLRDGKRLHATFALMLAAYAVSGTTIFTVAARWKSAICVRNRLSCGLQQTAQTFLPSLVLF